MKRVELSGHRGSFLGLRVKVDKNSKLHFLPSLEINKERIITVRAPKTVSLNNSEVFIQPRRFNCYNNSFNLPETYMFSMMENISNDETIAPTYLMVKDFCATKQSDAPANKAIKCEHYEPSLIFLLKTKNINHHVNIEEMTHVYGYLQDNGDEVINASFDDNVKDESLSNGRYNVRFIHTNGKVYSLYSFLRDLKTPRNQEQLIAVKKEYYEVVDSIKLFIKTISTSKNQNDPTIEIVYEELRDLLLMISTQLDKYRMTFDIVDVAQEIKSKLKPKTNLKNQVINKLNSMIVNVTNDVKVNKANTIERQEKIKDYQDSRILEIVEEFNSYRLDLVKMMKRPILVDLFDPKVSAFNDYCVAFELNQKINISNDYFYAKWVALQNYADTKKYSNFDAQQKRKLKDASTMLDKAMDPATTDNEIIACLRGLRKNLEGILPFTENNVEWFKEKTGLKELEA